MKKLRDACSCRGGRWKRVGVDYAAVKRLRRDAGVLLEGMEIVILLKIWLKPGIV